MKLLNTIPNDVPIFIDKATEDRLLLELAERVAKVADNPFKISGEEHRARYGLWDDTQFPELSENAIKVALGRKWKVCLGTLHWLVSIFDTMASPSHVTTFNFPQTSGKLLELFGSNYQISKVIQGAIAIGLIACVDENYAYGSDIDNFCKLYAWNKPRAKLVKDMVKKYGCRKELPKSVRMKLAKRNHGKKLKSLKEKISPSMIRITQKTCLPLSITNEEIVDAIRHNYPQIAWAQDTAIKLNENLPADEQISANPKIRRTGKVISKIGFRITNPIVSCKEHENENKDYNGRWRKEILKEKLGEWVEYDVKSSIYRVHYFITHGEWLSDEIDLYKEMAGTEFPSKESRNFYKQFAMSLYFENSVDSIRNHLLKKGIGSLNDEALNAAWNRMRFILGNPMKSEIFIHEGCIYLEALRRMIENHWKVIQVYDGFYVQKQSGITPDDIRNIIEDSAYWYRNTFLTSNKKG